MGTGSDDKRLIGDDGRLALGVLGPLYDASNGFPAGSWYKIISNPNTSFGSLVAGEYYYATEDFSGGNANDTVRPVSLVNMLDLSGWNLSISGDEVPVTVLMDKYKKYRKGKLDFNGTASLVFILGVTDEINTVEGEDEYLTLWATFENNVETGVVSDWSPRAIDSSSINSVPTYETGKIGSYAMHFDGTDDYVTWADSSDLEPGTGDFSVSFWFNHDNASAADEYLFKKKSGADEGWVIFLQNADSDKVRWSMENTLAANDSVDADAGPTDGQWYHVVCIRNSGLMTMWINGELQADTGTVAGDITVSDDLDVGGSAVISNFDGLLDDIRIYKRALTKQEVFGLYNNTYQVGMGNRFFDVTETDENSIVRVSRKITATPYIVGYLVEEDESGQDSDETCTLATLLEIDFYNFELPVAMSEPVTMEIPFRLVGDADPILYRLKES